MLLQTHNLEPVEVGERLTALLLELLLGPVGFLPLGINAIGFPGLLDGTRPRAAGKLRDHDGSEEGPGEGDDAAGCGELRVGGGTISEDLDSQHFTLLLLFALQFVCDASDSCRSSRAVGLGCTYALVVDNLDNSGQAAILELQHTANLDPAPRSRFNVDLCHCDDVLIWQNVSVIIGDSAIVHVREI